MGFDEFFDSFNVYNKAIKTNERSLQKNMHKN